MMDSLSQNTPRNKTGYIDETILNTPLPQASSTVERKGVPSNRVSSGRASMKHSKKFDKGKTTDFLDKIPTRDTDNASNKSNMNRLSTTSSLGILSMENVQDLQEFNICEQTKEFQANEKLIRQRALAQKTLDRIDSKSKTNVGGLPSYLLKPTNTTGNAISIGGTPIKNESTINLSDLEKSSRTSDRIPTYKTEKLSFAENEISARSSSLTNQNVFNLRSPSPRRGLSNDFNSKSQSIYDKIRQSDISITEVCGRNSKMGLDTQPLGLDMLSVPEFEIIDISANTENSWCLGAQDSLIAKLKNELFTPAELAGDKLLADEISWHKARDSIPVDFNSESNKHGGKDRFEVSCFSGIFGDEDISLKGSIKSDEKVSISEFFKRRTEAVEQLDLKTSPEKTNAPSALINASNSTNFDDLEDSNCPIKELTQALSQSTNEKSRLSDGSIMSISSIADALAKINIGDTPARIIEMFVKKKPQYPTLNPILAANEVTSPSSSNNSNCDNTTLKITPHKLHTDSTKTITLEDTPKENEFAPNTKMKTMQTTESILRDTSNILNQLKQKHPTDSDWMDAKPNCTPDTGNRTISSINESPSYSCSELDFSEDDSADNSLSQSCDWLNIDQPTKIHTLCTYIPQRLGLTFNSETNHWLLVKIFVKDIKHGGLKSSIAKIVLENKEGILKSNASEYFAFVVTSLVAGNIEIVLRTEITDMATKMQRNKEYTLNILSEDPKIKFSKDLLDFKLNPEAAKKKLILTVNNNSHVDLPVTFSINQDYDWIFNFTSESETDTESEETTKSCTIAAQASTYLYIEMRCPTFSELNWTSNIVEVKGQLRVYLSESRKLLKEANLTGSIGLTKIQFKTSCMPFTLLPGQTKPLKVRNSGVVTMDLAVKIGDERVSALDNYFSVEETSIVLKPGQMGTINVTFQLKDKIIDSIQRSLRLEYFRGPNFVFPIEGLIEPKSPDYSRSPKLSKSPLLSNSPKLLTAHPNTRRSIDRKSVSPNPNDRANTRNSQQGRISSNSSDSGTLSYLQDGKLPIESTRAELVWGCLKPGKTNTQEFILRNRCSQRVRLQATITGPGFKFVKEQSESVTNMSLMLHSLESRSIIVSFCPNTKGAAIGKLMFHPIENEVIHSKRQMILLYGYGGYSCVAIQKVAKDTGGKMWLSFGRLDYRETLHQSFILRNTGTLAAFAYLSVCCKVLYPFMDSSVKIYPTEVIIPPSKEVEVSISFTPRQDDFKYIQTSHGLEVSEIASIKILSGPEPTRGRIRRLFAKMGQQGSIPQLTKEFLIPKLSAEFPNEQMPLDLPSCKESAGAMKDLLRDFVTREVALTIEQDPEKSGFATALGADDSCMFQSLCNETAHLTLDVSHAQFESNRRRTSGGFCTVEPTNLMLTPPMKTQDTVLVSSRHSRPMPFEISLPSGGVTATPSVGVVPPGETTVITISCNNIQPKPLQFYKVMIYVENEVMEIEVKIHYLQTRRS